jgi:hypothetical protein
MLDARFHCLTDLAGQCYWTGHAFSSDPHCPGIIQFHSQEIAEREARRLARRGLHLKHHQGDRVHHTADLIRQVLDEAYGSERPKYERAARKRGIDLALFVAAAAAAKISGACLKENGE